MLATERRLPGELVDLAVGVSHANKVGLYGRINVCIESKYARDVSILTFSAKTACLSLGISGSGRLAGVNGITVLKPLAPGCW